ncbi:MAG: hypothetical protein ACR2PO_11590 [Methyloligellaceae bacterium]
MTIETSKSFAGRAEKDEVSVMLASLYGHLKTARRLGMRDLAYHLDMTILSLLEHADARAQAAFLKRFKKVRS